MISEAYSETVYVADFTDYVSKNGKDAAPCSGVLVGKQENGIIPSFVLTDDNSHPFIVVNNEKNGALYTKDDGCKVSQCECIIYADRHDNRKGWMIFLELKYCMEKNLYDNMLDGIGQLKDTCKYIMEEKEVFDTKMFKKYLVISTPGTAPLDPFDAFYFDQDFMLLVKSESGGGIIKATNVAHIQTPAVIDFE
jgi:hypothetical protein